MAHFSENSLEIFIVRTCCWASATLLCLNGNCRHAVLLKIKNQMSQMMGISYWQMYTRDGTFENFELYHVSKKYTRVLWNIQNQNWLLWLWFLPPELSSCLIALKELLNLLYIRCNRPDIYCLATLVEQIIPFHYDVSCWPAWVKGCFFLWKTI